MRAFFIKYHKKIDVCCIVSFLYFTMVLAMIYATSFVKSEEFRAGLVLITPIIFISKKNRKKVDTYIHRLLKLEE